MSSSSSPESLSNLPRWEGGFPGPHEFSGLGTLDRDPQQNPELEVFLDAAKRVVEKWQGNQFAGMYLYGTPGTGKTHAAIGLGRAMHEAGAEVHYRFVPELSVTTSFVGNRSSQDSYPPFPTTYLGNGGARRNPKSVLILDDYQPDKQAQVSKALEAAAQFGGFVIITSNYEDPFKLIETPQSAPDLTQAVLMTNLERENPEQAQKISAAEQAKAQELSASLRSRVAAGIRFIEFSGPDRRIANSFWND